MSRAQIRMLPDERRLHLQDGPIDLIVEAFGARNEIQTAYDATTARFTTILDELCTEMPLLRAAVEPGACPLKGMVARRMYDAVAPLACYGFITPMAAVAGAVAEETLAAMRRVAPGLERAYVNNGGDIALHLAPGRSFSIALIDRPDRPSLFGTARIDADEPVRGIATSGWCGRSFSLGIADAVTVLAASAAQADAAATIIANAVNLPGHAGIERAPACELQPDSDLGSRLVTRAVPALTDGEIDRALSAGLACAHDLRNRGLIEEAALHLQSETRSLALPDAPASFPAFTPDRRELAHG
ncbi:MAG: UPF0280 family protein [Rhodospirillaceae bacterium]|nr:UPF0280 family protein [Rhodospirillaceae bacterium]